MLKQILSVEGARELNKKEQTNIVGGNGCETYTGNGCYGVPGCGTCADYHRLSREHQQCVFVHTDCVQ